MIARWPFIVAMLLVAVGSIGWVSINGSPIFDGPTRFDNYGITVGIPPSDRSNWPPQGISLVGQAPGLNLFTTTRPTGQRLFGIFMRESDGVVEFNYGPDNQVGVQTGCQMDFYSNGGSPPAYTFACVGGVSASGVQVTGAGPVSWYNSAAGSDLKNWVAHQKTGDTSRFDFSVQNDALGVETPWLTAHRTGAAITDVVFPAAAPLYVAGSVAVGATAAISGTPILGAKCSSGAVCVGTVSASTNGAYQYTQPVDGAGVRWVINSKTGTAAEETFRFWSANGSVDVGVINGAGNGGNACFGAGCTSTASVALTVGNGTVNGLVVGASGASLLKHLSATASLDFDLSGAGITCQDLTITVTGAVAGDTVKLGIPDALASTAGVTLNAWISAADTCKVRACDVTSGNPNPAAATVRCDVDHH